MLAWGVAALGTLFHSTPWEARLLPEVAGLHGNWRGVQTERICADSEQIARREHHGTFDDLAVDVSAIAAAEIDEEKLAIIRPLEHGMGTRCPAIGQRESVVIAAPKRPAITDIEG